MMENKNIKENQAVKVEENVKQPQTEVRVEENVIENNQPAENKEENVNPRRDNQIHISEFRPELSQNRDEEGKEIAPDLSQNARVERVLPELFDTSDHFTFVKHVPAMHHTARQHDYSAEQEVSLIQNILKTQEAERIALTRLIEREEAQKTEEEVTDIITPEPTIDPLTLTINKHYETPNLDLFDFTELDAAHELSLYSNYYSSNKSKVAGNHITIDARGNEHGITVDASRVSNKKHDVTVEGSNGDDVVTGGRGDDVLNGYDGDDQLNGNKGHDVIYGHAGNDVLNGGNGGNDHLYGGAGDDYLTDRNGRNILDGGEGNDTIISGKGADTLIGGLGDDILEGHNQNDTLIGGLGADTLSGGDRKDRFVFESLNDSNTEFGIDRITDFNDRQDKIDFTALDILFDDVNIMEQSGHIIVTIDSTDFELHLDGLPNLNENDFIF